MPAYARHTLAVANAHGGAHAHTTMPTSMLVNTASLRGIADTSASNGLVALASA